MTIQKIVESCGYTSVLDMLKSNMTEKDYMDFLEEVLIENLDSVYDVIEDIAWQLGYVDEDKALEDKADLEYQRFKDERLG